MSIDRQTNEGLAEATNASLASQLNTSDVPFVGARELALAIKMLASLKGGAVPATLTDGDLRKVEETFWEVSRRPGERKIAVLLRLRSLVEALHQSKRLADLVAQYGQVALVEAASIAAKTRLNSKWGFNPHKLARAVSDALTSSAFTTSAAA